jgi:hypothetical protein
LAFQFEWNELLPIEQAKMVIFAQVLRKNMMPIVII